MSYEYGLPQASQPFAARAKQIADDTAAPHAVTVDREARFPEESVAALAAAGLNGLCVAAALGGHGQGPRTFAAVVENLAQACGSTAMIYVMHVSAQQAIAASTLARKDELLRQIAAGKHLATLALSEKGSRSQFWAPVSKLTPAGDGFTTSAFKSWVTSAGHADSYVSSAQIPDARSPLESALYLIKRGSEGVRVSGRFDGLGLRGNDSSPVSIESHAVARGELMTELGGGAKMMLEVVLPWFSVGTAAMSNGLARAAVAATGKHLAATQFEHTGTHLRDLPQLRARLAEMHVRTEQARALLGAALGEMENGAPDAALYVLSTRLASLQAAADVTDLAMKACGGAAFSRQLGVERLFRDARAGWVMAPTVDHLGDFLGKALTGLPLF